MCNHRYKEKERKERERQSGERKRVNNRGGRELLQKLMGGGENDCGTLIQCVSVAM